MLLSIERAVQSPETGYTNLYNVCFVLMYLPGIQNAKTTENLDRLEILLVIFEKCPGKIDFPITREDSRFSRLPDRASQNMATIWLLPSICNLVPFSS